MTRQIITSIKKDMLSIFYISLPGYPIACKINNVSLLSELLFNKTILAFGKYDLVFCLKKNEFEPDPAYDTAIVTRTFCETIQLARLPAALRGATEVQACFGQPLHVRIRIGKPLKLNLWDFLKSLITGKTWVEAQVEGQIAADITAAREPFDLELEFADSLLQNGVSTTAEQDNMAEHQKEAVVDLQTLADQVLKIISQREGEKAAKDEATHHENIELEQLSVEKPDTTPPDKGESEGLDAAKVTELVLNILHTREAARASQEQNRLQHPAGMQQQAHPNAPHPGSTRYAPAGYPTVGHPAAPFQIPLEQIPSRPGLEAFIQNPPPKPPEFGG